MASLHRRTIQKGLNDLDNYDGVVTHPEPDILKYNQVGLRKHCYEQSQWWWWIPAELFQILKDDAVKVPHSIRQQIWKTHQWPRDWRRSVFIPIPKKGNAKECSNYHTIVLISHASKVMLKNLQASPAVHEPKMCELRLEKAEELEVKLLTFVVSYRKQGNSRKTSTSASLTTLNLLTVWITKTKQNKKNMENSSRNGNTRPLYLSLEKPVCGSRSNC